MSLRFKKVLKNIDVSRFFFFLSFFIVFFLNFFLYFFFVIFFFTCYFFIYLFFSLYFFFQKRQRKIITIASRYKAPKISLKQSVLTKETQEQHRSKKQKTAATATQQYYILITGENRTQALRRSGFKNNVFVTRNYISLVDKSHRVFMVTCPC